MTMFPTAGSYTGMSAANASMMQQSSAGLNAQQMQGLGMGLAIGEGIGNIASSYIGFQTQRNFTRMQFQMENEYRKQAFEYQKKMFAENYRRILASSREAYAQIQNRIDQEQTAASMQIGELQRQSMAAQASSVASAAERGVDQGSVLIDAIAVNELRASTAIRLEQEWRLDALKSQMRGVEAQAEARIAQAMVQPLAPMTLPAPLQPPNYAAQALSSAADAFAMYARFQPQAQQERMAANL